MKEKDPERYAKYLEDARERSKARREQLKKKREKRRPTEKDTEIIEKIREQDRARSRKYYKKKKTEAANKKTAAEPGLQSEEEEKGTKPGTSGSRTEYWRTWKANKRAKLSRQKKQAIKTYDRKRKDKKQGVNPVNENQVCTPSGTKRKRARGPGRPKKRIKLLKADLCESIEEVRNEPGGMKTMRLLATKLKNKASRRCLKTIGLPRQAKKKSKKDQGKFSQRKKAIQKFFLKPEISRILPSKKFTTKAGEGRMLQMTLKRALMLYNEDNPKLPVKSVPYFRSCKPKNVRLLNLKLREYCACVYCVQVRLKLRSLNALKVAGKSEMQAEQDVPDAILCPKSTNNRFHEMKCIYGECSECGDLGKKLESVYRDVDKTKNVSWMRWDKCKSSYDDSKLVRKPVDKSGPVQNLIDELKDDLETTSRGVRFTAHLYQANWQALQYTKLRDDLPLGCLLQVIDFAKNRNFFYEEEIKSAFYTAEQMTMHPVVQFYKTESGTVRHSVIVFSEDTKHDHHAAHYYTELATKAVMEVEGVEVNKIIRFSDGCSSQYKSHGPFADVSLCAMKLDRNFFGSEHGKGEGDAEIGVVNGAIDRAIVGRQLVGSSCKVVFEWCRANLSLNDALSKRDFIFVQKCDFSHVRPETDVKANIKGVQKIHQLTNVPGYQYKIRYRNLSCFCKACMTNNEVKCQNEDRVGGFTEAILVPKRSKSIDIITSNVDLNDSSVVNKIVENLEFDEDGMITFDFEGEIQPESESESLEESVPKKDRNLFSLFQN